MKWLAPTVLSLLCSSGAAAADRCGIGGLALWATAEIPSAARFAGERIGGLSGIEYVPVLDRFLAITDDRGEHGGTRLYRLRLRPGAHRRLRVEIEAAALLPAPAFDAEAVRVNRYGTIHWTGEGDSAAGQGPGLYRLHDLRSRSEALPLPALLARDPAQRHGPRDNRSLEGLALDPADGSIWLGLEAPLAEQAPLPTAGQGSVTTLLHLPNDTSVAQRFDYPLEPIARQNAGLRADNGLAELLVRAGPKFLVLERSGAEQADGSFRFTTRLFCAWPEGDATLLAKQQIADLTALGPFDSANFEGMSFGPRLPDGRQSLVLVADNDFRPERPTLIAVFAVAP